MKYYIVYLLSLLPLKILYIFEPIVFFWLSKVMKYRKNVIQTNLKYVFPEKSIREINFLVKKHYKYLSVFLIESLKTLSMSEKSLKKRIKVIGKKEVEDVLKKKPVLILSMHISNWNWGAALLPSLFQESTYVIYEPLKDVVINKILKNIREKYGGKLISVFDLKKGFRQIKEDRYIVLLAADQCPDDEENKQWQVFLKKETLFFKGFSQIAKSFDMEIFFLDSKTFEKGHYTIKFQKLEKEKLESDEIAQKYISWLEEQITSNPTEWFWYHKRWKYSKEGNIYEKSRI